MSVVGATAENICSFRVFRILTPNGPQVGFGSRLSKNIKDVLRLQGFRLRSKVARLFAPDRGELPDLSDVYAKREGGRTQIERRDFSLIKYEGGEEMSDDRHETLSQEVAAAIKKEAIGQTAKWAIAGGITLLAFAVTGWWLVLKPLLSERLGGVPKNAVMAFDAESCPTGWGDYKKAVGRTIIGKGDSFEDSKFELDAKGRTLKPVLWPHGGEFLEASLLGGVPQNNETNKLNIVPWIALLFCKKE
jgi:hypothetical protein